MNGSESICFSVFLCKFRLACKPMTFFYCCLFFPLFSTNLKAQLVRAVPDSMPVLGKDRQPVYERAEITGRNQLGTVYALPQDRMPALRPDTTVTSRMPVHGSKQFRMMNRIQSLPPQRFGDSMILTPYGPRKLVVPK